MHPIGYRVHLFYPILSCMWIDNIFTGSSHIIHQDALPMPPCQPNPYMGQATEMAALRKLIWKIGPLSTGHQGAQAQCAKQDRCVQFAQTLVRELKTCYASALSLLHVFHL